jgi:hypothetical protein
MNHILLSQRILMFFQPGTLKFRSYSWEKNIELRKSILYSYYNSEKHQSHAPIHLYSCIVCSVVLS